MSRTDQLRRGGARERGGGGGGAPFVKWPDRYSWVEGRVVTTWEGKYGLSATVEVTVVSDGLQAKGKTEDGEPFIRPITPGVEVNVGLNYATLEGTIKPDDEGKYFHVAFEGWGETKNGDRYRVFAVLEVDAPDAERAEPGKNAPTTEEVKSGMSREESYEPADDLPF